MQENGNHSEVFQTLIHSFALTWHKLTKNFDRMCNIRACDSEINKTTNKLTITSWIRERYANVWPPVLIQFQGAERYEHLSSKQGQFSLLHTSVALRYIHLDKGWHQTRVDTVSLSSLAGELQVNLPANCSWLAKISCTSFFVQKCCIGVGLALASGGVFGLVFSSYINPWLTRKLCIVFNIAWLSSCSFFKRAISWSLISNCFCNLSTKSSP